jgi:hypothetical protein
MNLRNERREEGKNEGMKVVRKEGKSTKLHEGMDEG